MLGLIGGERACTEENRQNVQHNLFPWDFVAVGSGYGSLARLDFELARRSFASVLQTIPDHGRAALGYEIFNIGRTPSKGCGDRMPLQPCLCGGYPYLETGNFAEAERQLCLLLKKRPHAGLLHLFLAEALRRQQKEGLARLCFALGLLLDPAETARQGLGDADLARLCEECGPVLIDQNS